MFVGALTAEQEAGGDFGSVHPVINLARPLCTSACTGPYSTTSPSTHGLRQVGKKFVFSINGVDPEDAGLYQVEVDGVKIFSTDFKRKMMHQINS